MKVPVPCRNASSETLIPYANVASTCAMPISPHHVQGRDNDCKGLRSSEPDGGETEQSSVSSVGEPSW